MSAMSLDSMPRKGAKRGSGDSDDKPSKRAKSSNDGSSEQPVNGNTNGVKPNGLQLKHNDNPENAVDRHHIDALPDELLQLIMIQYLGCDPTKEKRFYGKIPTKWCLVSRRWCGVFSEYLYSHFTFDGEPQNYKKLWCFLRTVYESPGLAKYVKHVTMVTSNGFQAEHRPGLFDGPRGPDHPHKEDSNKEEWMRSLARLSEANFPWLRKAMQEAGLGHMVKRAKQMLIDRLNQKNQKRLYVAVKKLYTQPLIATILAHCGNIRRLHLHVSPADNFYRTVLYHATTKDHGPRNPAPLRIAFQKLVILTVTPAWFIEPSQELEDAYDTYRYNSINIGDDDPYYLLPKLTDFTALGCTVRFDPRTLKHDEEGWTGHSSIRKLTLSWATAHRFQFEALATMLPNLTQLTMALPGETIRHAGPNFYYNIWSILAIWEQTLEHLDIYQPRFMRLQPLPGPIDQNDPEYAPEIVTDSNRDYCFTLANFIALKHLSVPLIILGAYECEHDTHTGPKTKLTDHLPPNLLSLGLYITPTDKVLEVPPQTIAVRACIRQLKKHLLKIPEWAATKKPPLKGFYFTGGDKVPWEDMFTEFFLREIQKNLCENNVAFFGGISTTAGDLDRAGVSWEKLTKNIDKHGAKDFLPVGLEVHGQVGELE
ncbi:hypothetical protein BJY04DRAFT_217928 [Aspergillus karnatakaensis]|uniref:uncharacterized protein n=1 Tax=Aspergillus karnatakaensis TaxID=1810916 RepID=UPI003CCE3CB8